MSHEDEIREIARRSKIEAVKRYRELYPAAGLKEAKDAVDAIAGEDAAQSLPASAHAEVDALIRDGRKIQAIKLYRELHPALGLKEAKEAVEARSEVLGVAKSGCFIATAAFGGGAAEVAILKQYRDTVLRRSGAGRAFVRIYYRLSPPVADLVRRSPAARSIARAFVRAAVRLCPARRFAGGCSEDGDGCGSE